MIKLISPDEAGRTSQQEKRKRLFQIFVSALCFLPLVAIWYFDYLPLQDYPNHFARFHILSNYGHSDFYSENFRIEPFKGISPLPHLALDLFVNKLMTFLDIHSSMRIFISLYVILYVTSIYLLARQLKLNISLLLLINLPLIYSCFFSLGLLNFIFSIPLFLFAILVLYRYEIKRTNLHIFFLGLLSIFMYLVHIFTFFIFCIFLSLHLLTRRLKIKEYIYLLIAIFPSLFFSINYIVLSTSITVTVRKTFLEKLANLNFHFFNLPDHFFKINSILFAVAIYLVIRNSSVKDKLYLSFSAILVLFYFVLPFASMNGSYIDVRTLLFALILFPFSLKINNNIYIGVVKLILLIVFFISFSWLLKSSMDFNENFSTKCAEKIEEKSFIFPIDASSIENEIKPFIHSWGYFIDQVDFITPYLFSGVQQQIVYTNKPPAPSEYWALYNDIESGAKFMDKISNFYEYILLFGNNSDVESLIGDISFMICSDKSVRLYKINIRGQVSTFDISSPQFCYLKINPSFFNPFSSYLRQACETAA
jgi:hypothetical protein